MHPLVRTVDKQVGSLVLASDYLAPTPCGPRAVPALDVTTSSGCACLSRWCLLARQELFDAHHRHEDGWDSPEAATTYEQDGHQLRSASQKALPDAVVRLDLWSITG